MDWGEGGWGGPRREGHRESEEQRGHGLVRVRVDASVRALVDKGGLIVRVGVGGCGWARAGVAECDDDEEEEEEEEVGARKVSESSSSRGRTALTTTRRMTTMHWYTTRRRSL
jgi:regulation of enolase protein 1 (concanavalin A-like superfamily)